MRRSALRDLFRHLVLASLPLAGAACSRDGLPGPGGDGGPTVDAACDMQSTPPFDCTSRPIGFVPVDGPLPKDGSAACFAACPVCTNGAVVAGCFAIDTCLQHGVICSTAVPGRRTAGLEGAVPVVRFDGDDGDTGDAEARGGQQRSDGAAGLLFARMAWMEAASVPAFRRLARELRALGAPASLVEAARRSARDEIRHARLMSSLAARHGATVVRPRPPSLPLRSLVEVALENAVEGCVFEAFSALLATWQAQAAPDQATRATMATIAEDETNHAALAWAVSRWAERLLDEADRARVEEARRTALARLLAAPAPLAPAEAARHAGLPDAEGALHLARLFAARLLDGSIAAAS